jgi:hypothetical protein
MRNDVAIFGAFLVAVALMAMRVPEGPAQDKTDAIKVTAQALHKEFKDNTEAARTKYAGKLVQVSGVSGGQTGTEVFFLKEKKDGEVLVSGSYYDIPKAEQAKLKEIKPNTSVVVVGKFSSFVSGKVELTDTRLVRIEK